MFFTFGGVAGFLGFFANAAGRCSGLLSHFGLEFLHATGSVYEAQFAGVKWMAQKAELNFEFFFSGANSEFITTGAFYFGGWEIFWMSGFFHMICEKFVNQHYEVYGLERVMWIGRVNVNSIKKLS